MITPTREKINLVEVNCPVCGSTRSKTVFNVKDYAFRVTNSEFGVCRCLDCHCGYLSPRPCEGDMAQYYPAEFYWSYERGEGPMSWNDVVASRKKQIDAKVRWIGDRAPGRLLDIGAQKGEFLWAMQQRGWQAEGVEMDESVPNPASMSIKYGDFLSMDFESSNFDLITMWAVLEHVYHPAKFVERIVQLLKPGGQFVALVTNFNSIQSRFYHADDYPRHLTLFSKNSVQRLCKRHNLELKRLETSQHIFGGSLHGGLVNGFKRLFGYSHDEVRYEWKSLSDPYLFCCKWRGKPNWLVRNVSRTDKLMSLPLERVLDRIGYGFNMTFTAMKPIAGYVQEQKGDKD